MDRKTSPKPTLCRGGCGFYGSAATEGLCSECYKKHVEQQQEAVAKSLKAMSTKEPILHKAADNTGSKLKINQQNDSNAIAIAATTSAADDDDDDDDNNANSEESPNAGLPSTSQTVPPPTAATAIATATTPPTPPTDPNHLNATPTPETAPKEKKNRCAECGKKVGLTGFTCRCGGLFCPIHRYSDKHNCTFNYREMGAEEIRRNNPTVTAEKIRKI